MNFIVVFLTDNEERQLPDHEAAHCLLSLSQQSTCDENTLSTNLLIPCQPITYPYIKDAHKSQPNESDFMHSSTDEISYNRHSITSTTTTTATVTANDNNTLLSELNQRRPNKNSDPIDLSKPRAGSTTSYSGAAGLVQLLMTLSDKVPSLLPPSTDLIATNYSIQNANLLQTYLTERALQKSKMKLSQMTQNAYNEKNGKIRDNDSVTVQTTANFSDDVWKKDWFGYNRPKEFCSMRGIEEKSDQRMTKNIIVDESKSQEIFRKQQNMGISIENNQKLMDKSKTEEQTMNELDTRVEKPLNETLTHSKNISDHSNMATLAEIAANSVKLDGNKTTEQPLINIHKNQQSVITSFNVSSKLIPKQQLTLSTTTTTTMATATTTTAAPISNEQISWREKTAKNIASKYLRIANEQDNSIQNVIDDSSGSSDSDLANNDNTKSIRRISHHVAVASSQDVLISAQTVVVGKDGFKCKTSNSNDLKVVPLPHAASNDASRTNVAFLQEDGGPSICPKCSTSFPKASQLKLHMNIHYMNPERKYRCKSCGLSFNSQGRLQKHLRSEPHNTKVNMVESLGTSTSKNPRPFDCTDCNKAFRIHGHLAKHLRSKTHIQKLESQHKLPTDTYVMIEEARISLTDIDTTDCDNSLASLKTLAERLIKLKKSKSEAGSPEKTKNTDKHSSSNDAMNSNDGHDSDSRSNDETDYVAAKKRKLNEGDDN